MLTDDELIAMLGVVAVGLLLVALQRIVLLLHPVVVEGETIVEAEALVVDAERILRRAR